MVYLATIHVDENAWEALGEDARAGVYAQYGSLVGDARAAGVLVDGNELGPTATATTVRVQDGETLVSDGPYAEVKEALGGYFLFECATIEEAVDWAARIPGAAHGAVEVRAVHVDPEA